MSFGPPTHNNNGNDFEYSSRMKVAKDGWLLFSKRENYGNNNCKESILYYPANSSGSTHLQPMVCYALLSYKIIYVARHIAGLELMIRST